MAEQEEKQQSKFIGWIQRQATPVRYTIFFSGMIGIILLVFAVTAVLYYLNIRGYPRSVPIALQENATTQEFVQFEEADTYPSALATAADGTLYVGSYLSGTIWQIDSAGNASEIPGTSEAIGSVIGMDVAADGSIVVLDRVEALALAGAAIWRSSDGEVEQIGSLSPENISLPNDIAVDDSGNIYVADIDTTLHRIWRFAPDSDAGEIWWTAPQDTANPAGLAYDSANNRLLVTEVARDAIYAIPLDADDPVAATETIFQYEGAAADAPGFNGITVAPDGTIYIAALGQNEVLRLEDGELVTLAAGYRGASDVAYDANTGRVFVNNWDQSWLTPVQFFIIRFYVEPRLPFSVDVIEFER